MQSENKRIARNTVFMYIRMFIILILGLLTSRLVLKNLGVEDYGLYNVIGGVIAMLGFISGSMTNTTSRFITFYLGKNNLQKLKEVFSMAVMVHIAIAFVIIILGETVGLWYVYNKLVVPEGRFHAALVIYQVAIASAAASLLYVPFNSLIVAHEKMNAYAYISIIDASLKFLVAYMIAFCSSDKLVTYSFLILSISLLDVLMYEVYSKKHFEETSFIFFWDKKMFKEVFGFAGWSLFGNFSYLFYSQGTNLMLNIFFGTGINAVRGISLQVESVARQFSGSVQTALNPQIIKSYADNRMERMYSLIFASSRYCYFLLLMLAIPVIIESRFLMDLWLDEVPEHTVSFVQITMAMIVLDGLSNPLYTSSLASGQVKLYQLTLGIISYSLMPLTYFLLKWSMLPEMVLLCLFLCRILEQVARIIIAKKQIDLPVIKYCRSVLVRNFAVTVLSLIVPLLIFIIVPDTIMRFFIAVPVSVLAVLLSVYAVGINNDERLLFNRKARSLIHQW